MLLLQRPFDSEEHQLFARLLLRRANDAAYFQIALLLLVHVSVARYLRHALLLLLVVQQAHVLVVDRSTLYDSCC